MLSLPLFAVVSSSTFAFSSAHVHALACNLASTAKDPAPGKSYY